LSATRSMISAAFTMLRNSKLRAASVGPEQGPHSAAFRDRSPSGARTFLLWVGPDPESTELDAVFR
jgi:hypothetical protein